MHTICLVLALIVSILLILIVLIQKSKGGGLSSQFGNVSAQMGVQQTNTFLEKTTWTLIAALVVLSVASVFFSGESSSDPRVQTPMTDTSAGSNQFSDQAAPVQAPQE